MNLNLKTTSRSPSTTHGSATILMLALLVILLIIVLANGRIILNLQRELKLIERQQIERSSATRNGSTNSVDKSTAPNQTP